MCGFVGCFDLSGRPVDPDVLARMTGTLVHRGGAHRGAHTRLAITPQYCEPWIRQIENMPLAVPPELARGYSERVQELLGYDIFEPTFIGYVDGTHPKRLLDPTYSARKKGPTRILIPD